MTGIKHSKVADLAGMFEPSSDGALASTIANICEASLSAVLVSLLRCFRLLPPRLLRLRNALSCRSRHLPRSATTASTLRSFGLGQPEQLDPARPAASASVPSYLHGHSGRGRASSRHSKTCERYALDSESDTGDAPPVGAHRSEVQPRSAGAHPCGDALSEADQGRALCGIE
jgi:hypothetical protein